MASHNRISGSTGKFYLHIYHPEDSKHREQQKQKRKGKEFRGWHIDHFGSFFPVLPWRWVLTKREPQEKENETNKPLWKPGVAIEFNF